MTTKAQFRTHMTVAFSVLMLLVLYGIAIGPSPISIAQVVQSLLMRISPAADGWLTGDLARWQHTVVWQVRMPRVFTGALVGASLAVSGAVLQGLFRNPLASSDLLGVSAGATLGAAVAIFFGFSVVYIWAIPMFAIAGAAATIAVVYGISVRSGAAPMTTILLVGIAAGAFNIAMYSLVLALSLQNWEVGAAIVYWTLGSLEARTWEHVFLVLPVFAAGLLVVSCYLRELDILLVGEVHAVSLGVDVARVRVHLLAATAALTGTAVAVSGTIGFVGLVVPHIVRLVIGPHHRHLIPLSALTGALVLVGADLLLRSALLSNWNVPLGALTSVMGAPFFLYLLLKQERSVMS